MAIIISQMVFDFRKAYRQTRNLKVFTYSDKATIKQHGLVLGLILLLIFQSQISMAQNRSQYHLFNPTPKELMRPLYADRPDVTETPYTVDAGRFQFEFDFLNLYRHPLTLKSNETDILFFNGIAKVGITDYADFELVFSANQWHFPDNRNIPKDTLTNRRGFGDIGLRTKINLLGNKHQEFGLALMPTVLLPLNNEASDQIYMPGISVLWAYSFAERWELGGQVEYFRLYDLDKRPLFNEYWATLMMAHDFTERFSSFLEYVAIIGEKNNYVHTFNSGIIYEITPNFFIDMGFHLGLNERSPSSVFSGFSLRL